MTLGKFLAWLVFTALVGIAGQFTDRSPSSPDDSKRLLASPPPPARAPADADAPRLVRTQVPVAQAHTEQVSVATTP